MQRLGSLLLLAALIAPTEAEATHHLCLPFSRTYARLAELPAGAAAALGFPIAERGAPWNATDAVRPGPLLPFARFISAEGGGCTLTIRYEHGGIAHSYETATLVRRGEGWALERRR